MTGVWIYNHPNGNVAAQGEMYLDNHNGVWRFYDINGLLTSELTYKNGSLFGKCKLWHPNGQISQDIEYEESGNLIINAAWDENGKQNVVNGNGTFRAFHRNGTISDEGKVKDGYRSGIWTSYYFDGSIKFKGVYDTKGVLVINEYHDEFGKQLIKDGNGKATFLNEDGTYEEGQVKNGYRDGDWALYNSEGTEILVEMKYVNGKVNGTYKAYFPGSGILRQESYFENGKLSGITSFYYENGELESSASFVDGKKDGTQIFYNDLGLQIREEIYKDGELVF